MKIFLMEDEIGFHPRNEILKVLAGHDFTIATNSYEARTIYRPGTYDLLLLDHDMHGFYEEPEAPDTGTQFVKWLVNVELGIVQPKPKVLLHSQNDMGRRAMASLLAIHGFRYAEHRFGASYLTFLRDSFTHSTRRTRS